MEKTEDNESYFLGRKLDDYLRAGWTGRITNYLFGSLNLYEVFLIIKKEYKF